MKKTLLTILGIVILAIVLVALAGVYKFNYLASQPGYDVDGNKISGNVEDDFEIIEVLGQSCRTDADCKTPIDYAIQSSCPYDSVCIDSTCAVVCPHPYGGQSINEGSRNTTYVIEGESVTLVDGLSEKEVSPNSAAKVTTRYFGNEVTIDLNDDGREDTVFLLTQSTGGSGTFFYVVAALNTEDGWVGSQAFLLGDRIAPQTTEVSDDPNHQNVIVVNYADRAIDQPMSAEPSVGKSVWLKLNTDSMTFGTVEQNFPGEADPNMMTLDMKPWTWIKTTYNNDTELVPLQTGAFVLTFKEDNSISVTTDCNSMSGTYEVIEHNITFGPMAATRMFCEGSQEQNFSAMLAEIQSFYFTSRGELVFNLKFDSGSSVFR